MKRILGWMAVGTGLLLSACGGSLQSPDFKAQLVGIQISPTTNNVDVGGTVQFKASGLYSSPPGTTDGVQCATGLCTVGTVDNVSWSVKDTALASVDSSGNVKGLRRGSTSVIATAQGFSSSAILTVGGVVLQSLVVTPSTASVAAGRTQTFTVQGIYSDSSTPRTVNETVTWTSNNTSSATVSPSQGASTTATTKSPGSVTVTASATNSEGDLKSTTATLTVGAAVLDQLVISPSSVSTPQGTTVTVTVQGIYSDSSTARTVVEDVNWSIKDATIATVSPTLTTGGNNGVVGSASSANTGSTLLSASAKNGEGQTKTASINFAVTSATLTAVTGITPANPTIPLGTTQLFTVQGTFSDAPSTPRNLNADLLDFVVSSTAIGTVDNVDDGSTKKTKGTVTPVATGSTTITASLKNGSFPSVTSQRSVSTNFTVSARYCRVQSTTTDSSTTATVSANNVCLSTGTGACSITNKDNVISANTNDYATFNIAPSLTGYTLTLAVKKNDTSAAGQITPTTTPVAYAGFVFGIGSSSPVNPSTDFTLSTLAADGTTVVETIVGPTIQDLNQQSNQDNLKLAFFKVTKPYYGISLAIKAAGATGSPTGTVGQITGTGVPVAVNAYSSCPVLTP